MSSSSKVESKNISDLKSIITENNEIYVGVCEKALESRDNAILSCFKTRDDYIAKLLNELDNPDITFEQKMILVEKIEEAQKKKEDMTRENDKYLTKILKSCYIPLFLLLILVGYDINKRS